MTDRPYDVVILGATGYTGRQAVRAMRRQATHLRWAVAGRNVAAMQALVGESTRRGAREAAAAVNESTRRSGRESAASAGEGSRRGGRESGAAAGESTRRGARKPGVLLADTTDAGSLATLASQTKVLLNLAGPYALTGEAAIEACIAAGTHYLDLSGETFWVRRMIERHHDAAAKAEVRIIPSCGYEVLPFDIATLWVADALRQRHGAPCREVKLVVAFTGRRITRLADAASGGTVATLRMLLEHDHSDSIRNMACLLPAARADALSVARRNAIDWTPHYDADAGAVTAPSIPAPFVNPPMVLRSWALIDDETLFTPDFRYREGSNMAAFVATPRFVPAAAALPLQYAAAATLTAPLAALGATLGGPLQFQRRALAALIERFAPQPGEGPGEAALDRVGYELTVFATAADGQRVHGRVTAEGHPGYRSTPEMVVAMANGLADGRLGRTPHVGIVTPASGLGLEAVGALRAAGVRFALL